MTTKNLWGELPEVESVRTPVAILREQASLLTEMTKGALSGEVATSTKLDGTLRSGLTIAVPALGNYRYHVLMVEHPVVFYPLRVISQEANFPCGDEASYIAALEKVLTSPRVRKAIQALLAQSNAA